MRTYQSIIRFHKRCQNTRRAARALLMTVSLTGVLHGGTIATFPGQGGENIAISASGDIFATSFDDGRVYRITPGGVTSVFGQAPGPVAGAAFTPDGTLIVVGISSVYRFAPDGTVSLVTNIAGSGDLNGVTPLSPDSVLVADDATATVWQVNLNAGTSSA